jgi:hypothetical protein
VPNTASNFALRRAKPIRLIRVADGHHQRPSGTVQSHNDPGHHIHVISMPIRRFGLRAQARRHGRNDRTTPPRIL